MKDWLEKFALSQQTPKMKKTASQVIVNKTDLVDACDGDIVSFEDAQYKVIDCNYKDDKGEGVVLEKCAALVGDPMEVAMGTSVDYDTFSNKPQEYARTTELENLDNGAEEAEVAKFTEEAEDTAATIENENSIDGTTGFTHPNRILQRIIDKYSVVPVVEEEPVIDDSIVDEYTDVDFEVEETPVEDEGTFEVPDTTLTAKDMRKKKVACK